MNRNRRYSLLAASLAAALALALPASRAVAQNGTMARRTLTFSASPTATLTFGIQSLLVSDPGSPPTTILQLEFGRDGSGSVVDPGLGTGVNFTLTRTSVGGGSLTFPITSLPSSDMTISGKEISMSRPDPTATPGLLTLTIAHTASTPAAETWSLAISAVPNPTPAIRGIASLFGASTGFSTLSPVGVVSGGTPTTCPLGQACRGPCPLKPCLGPWRIYFIPEIKWPRGPWPGPECPQCQPQWNTEYDRSRFARVLVTFLPTPEQRRGIEESKDIRFEISGGELLGSLTEGARGEFIGMVQYPRGQSPHVHVVSQGTPLADFQATPELSPDARKYRNAAYALGALLIGALAGLGVMARRRGAGGRAVQG